MRKQIPHGPEDLFCPHWQKAMSEVCHKCPKWTQIRGKHPQSGEDVDEWNCSDALLPMLLMEHSRQQRSTAAAVETMTSEMQKTRTDSEAMIGTLLTLVNRSIDAQRNFAIESQTQAPKQLT